jgi:hypothetical protein
MTIKNRETQQTYHLLGFLGIHLNRFVVGSA